MLVIQYLLASLTSATDAGCSISPPQVKVAVQSVQEATRAASYTAICSCMLVCWYDVYVVE